MERFAKPRLATEKTATFTALAWLSPEGTGRIAALIDYTDLSSLAESKEHYQACTVRELFEVLTQRAQGFEEKAFSDLGALVDNGLLLHAAPPGYLGYGDRIHKSDVSVAIIKAKRAGRIDLGELAQDNEKYDKRLPIQAPVEDGLAHEYRLPLCDLWIVRANLKEVCRSLGMVDLPWPHHEFAQFWLRQSKIEELEIEESRISEMRPKDISEERWRKERLEQLKTQIAALRKLQVQPNEELTDSTQNHVKATGSIEDYEHHPHSGASEETVDGAAVLAPIRRLESLKARDLRLTLLANRMIEVSARGINKRVSYEALDLLDRRSGTPNTQAGILLGMASGKCAPITAAKAVSNLRKIFKHHIGLSEPFKHRPHTGWEPRFKINDNRHAQEERAKRNAKHVPYDDQILPDEQTRSYEQENDEAARWLDEHDR